MTYSEEENNPENGPDAFDGSPEAIDMLTAKAMEITQRIIQTALDTGTGVLIGLGFSDPAQAKEALRSYITLMRKLKEKRPAVTESEKLSEAAFDAACGFASVLIAFLSGVDEVDARIPKGAIEG